MGTLFINACMREKSRTLRLAGRVLELAEGPVEEHRLSEMKPLPLDGESLRFRTERAAENDFSDASFSLAKTFAAADEIVIAAPYWDLSFPAALKAYTERIMVCGIVFVYGSDGVPLSLCRAKKLTYVSTAGGYITNGNEGYEYIKLLANTFWGITDTRLIQAEGLDIDGADAEKILAEAAASI